MPTIEKPSDFLPAFLTQKNTIQEMIPKPLFFRLLILASFLLICVALLQIRRERHAEPIADPSAQKQEKESVSTPEFASSKPIAGKRTHESFIDVSSGSAAGNQEEEGFHAVVLMNDLLDNGETSDALRKARTLHQHPDREVRLSTVETLRWIGPPAAMDVAAMIDDSDEQIRGIARDTFWSILHKMDDPLLKKDLLEIALRSNDPELRIDALDELLYLPDELSSNLLSRAVNDSDKAVAEQAQRNLSFITGEDLKAK